MSNIAASLYVYAYSWTPGFCYSCYDCPGCLAPHDYWKNNFTIHGLWAQYSTSGYPSYCTTEPFDSDIPTDLGWDTMTELWPNVQSNETDVTNYESFWEHEWTKHGTCSGLAQPDYFETALNLTTELLTPDILHNAIGQPSMNADNLRTAMGGLDYVSLQCENNNDNTQILTGVYTCWQKNESDNYPSYQIACPDEVLSEDTCKQSANITILNLY